MLGALTSLLGGDLVKANIGSTEAGVTFDVPFNPSTLKLTRAVTWTPTENQGDSWPIAQFSKGQLDKLSFSLLFDETESKSALAKAMAGGKVPNPFAVPVTALPAGPAGTLAALALVKAKSAASLAIPKNTNTVTGMLKAMQALTLATVTDPNKGTTKTKRPPIVKFKWGDFVFDGFVQQFVADINLFDEKGNPKRATVEVSMEGVAFSGVDSTKFLAPDKLDAAAEKTKSEGSKAPSKV
jgi:hypothetical protein